MGFWGFLWIQGCWGLWCFWQRGVLCFRLRAQGLRVRAQRFQRCGVWVAAYCEVRRLWVSGCVFSECSGLHMGHINCRRSLRSVGLKCRWWAMLPEILSFINLKDEGFLKSGRPESPNPAPHAAPTFARRKLASCSASLTCRPYQPRIPPEDSFQGFRFGCLSKVPRRR